MQITKLGFLSLLSCVSLASSSSLIRCATPAELPDQVAINENIYGWKGPGVYSIVTFARWFDKPEKLNVEIKTDGSVINLQPPNNSNSQRWLIAYVGKEQYTISNNGTGRFISATTSKGIVKGYTGSPWDRHVRWNIDPHHWPKARGKPVLFYNKALPGNVLTGLKDPEIYENKIIVSPLENPKAANQAWLLEYLE